MDTRSKPSVPKSSLLNPGANMVRAWRGLLLGGSLLATSAATCNDVPPPAPDASPVDAIEQRLTELYQRYQDAVVKVKIASQARGDSSGEQVSVTVLSGFFIDESGTVLTNAIPLSESGRARVEIDGIQYLAVPIGSDSVSNLGLLRLAKPPAKVSFVDLSEAAEPPPIGSLAYAITSPLNFGSTPKLGQVTGRESSFQDIAFPFPYLRVSISSGPAEGGSPVFDAQGKLLGISVASLPDIESSYLVPTKPLRRIVESIKSGTPFPYPTVRAMFQERGDPISQSKRVVVQNVLEGSPASQTGLKQGDIVLEYEDQPVTNLNQLRAQIFDSQIGSFVTLLVSRKDEEIEIPIFIESSLQTSTTQ